MAGRPVRDDGNGSTLFSFSLLLHPSAIPRAANRLPIIRHAAASAATTQTRAQRTPGTPGLPTSARLQVFDLGFADKKFPPRRQAAVGNAAFLGICRLVWQHWRFAGPPAPAAATAALAGADPGARCARVLCGWPTRSTAGANFFECLCFVRVFPPLISEYQNFNINFRQTSPTSRNFSNTSKTFEYIQQNFKKIHSKLNLRLD